MPDSSPTTAPPEPTIALHPPRIRIPPRPASDGASRRAGARGKAASDCRSRHWHWQDAGLSDAGNSLGQAGHYFYWNEKSAGATLLQRHSLSRASALSEWRGQVERLLHERPQQLSLPKKTLRSY